MCIGLNYILVLHPVILVSILSILVNFVSCSFQLKFILVTLLSKYLLWPIYFKISFIFVFNLFLNFKKYHFDLNEWIVYL